MQIKDENLINLSGISEPLSALEQLEQLIPQYAVNKAELDNYKKLCDTENTEIKKLMTDLDITTKEVNGYVATKTVTTRESIDEPKLISILKKEFPIICSRLEVIKAREYIDFDVLESAMYNENLPEDMILAINRARESKDVVTLRISKKRKKKEVE